MRHCGQIPHFFLVLCAVSVAVHPALADCEAWPGEPTPIATVSSSDDWTAHYARLRARELSALARELEPLAPGDAYRVWLHVACLDPQDEEAREGALRVDPLRVHSPEVVNERSTPTFAAPDVATAFRRLDDPIVLALARRGAETTTKPVAVRAARVRPQPAPRLAPREEEPLAADGLLTQAEGLVRQAHFEEALEKAKQAREAVPPSGNETALRQRRARADVIAGTAEVALGKDADARASFARALQSDPNLHLDPASTSPKVVRAFDAARAAASGGAP